MWQIKSRGLVSLREREGEQVKDLEMALNVEAEWVLERLSESLASNTDRSLLSRQVRPARTSEKDFRSYPNYERERGRK
jgi:hypothetical protein